MMALCSIGEVAVLLGVSVVTLRRWEKAGRLAPACRTVGGHRRYAREAVLAHFGWVASVPATGKTIAYARVSSHDQKAQLETQAQRLRQHCAAHGWTEREVITDLGSGMNCTKKGLLLLLKALLSRRVARLVLVTQDRLLRFGADLLFKVCALTGVEVVVLDEPQPLPLE